MSLTTLLTTILIGVLVPTITGCSSSSTGPLTQAQLAAKSNAICGPLNAHLAMTEYGTAPHLALHGQTVYAWERAALSELEELVPPSTLAGDWTAVLTGLRTLADHTERAALMAKALIAKHVLIEKAFPFLAADQYAGERAAAIAERDGWHECAQVTLWHNV